MESRGRARSVSRAASCEGKEKGKFECLRLGVCVILQSEGTYANRARQHAALAGVVECRSVEPVASKHVPTSHITKHSPGGPLERLDVLKVGFVGVLYDALSFNGSRVGVTLASQTMHWWKVDELFKAMTETFRLVLHSKWREVAPRGRQDGGGGRHSAP